MEFLRVLTGIVTIYRGLAINSKYKMTLKISLRLKKYTGIRQLEEVLFPKAVIQVSLGGGVTVNGRGVCWVTQRERVHSWWAELGEQGILGKDWEARSSPSR